MHVLHAAAALAARQQRVLHRRLVHPAEPTERQLLVQTPAVVDVVVVVVRVHLRHCLLVYLLIRHNVFLLRIFFFGFDDDRIRFIRDFQVGEILLVLEWLIFLLDDLVAVILEQQNIRLGLQLLLRQHTLDIHIAFLAHECFEVGLNALQFHLIGFYLLVPCWTLRSLLQIVLHYLLKVQLILLQLLQLL